MIIIFDLLSEVSWTKPGHKAIYVKNHVRITWSVCLFVLFFLTKSLLAIDHTGEVLIIFRISLAKLDV